MNKRRIFTTLFLLLALCPSLIFGDTKPSTGLEGVIVVSPAHAGPTQVDVPDAAPLANVDFDVKKGDEIVASFRTDELGRFRISLAPGHYMVSTKEGKPGIGRRGSFEVDVVAGQVKHVQWTWDAGLR